ncbi:thymidine kinase [Halobacteriales archaeon QS_9_67_17]|nr:MAG: thymidine kinase [Halobacteriales archaeon QS_9_67_17]
MHAITNSGWVEVVTGSMFSGKTEELLRRLRRAEIAGQSVAAFAPALDDRYGTATIGSHAGQRIEATVVDESDPAPDIHDALNGASVVAIDEANFFSDALVDACESLAADGRRVIVSGTDQTFRGEPFDPLPALMAVAEYVDKYQAIWDESYEARCRDCHVVRTD